MLRPLSRNISHILTAQHIFYRFVFKHSIRIQTSFELRTYQEIVSRINRKIVDIVFHECHQWLVCIW